MTTRSIPFRMSLAAMAAAAVLTACGGGDASPPPGSQDDTPPGLTITDNVSAATATGPITFTFIFSEPVTGFTVDDIVVNGGTPGSFTMGASNTTATLVVVPETNTTGTVQVSVAAGRFSDLAGNANTVAVSASQAFDTTSPPPSGNTGTCTAAPCINFSEPSAGLVAFGGLENGAEITIDPVDASNQVARLAKEAEDQTWGGVTVHLGTDDFTVARIDPTQGITLRVYSPAAGETVMVKIENSANPSVFVEATATSTVGGQWETLSFTYPSADTNAVYDKVSVFPAFGIQADRVFYIDELKYVAQGDAPGPTPLTYASAFSGSGATTAQGGSFGGYSGGDQDGWNCTNANSFCGLGLNDGEGQDRLFYYYVAPASTTALYSGVYVMAPGVTALSGNVSGLSVAGRTRFTFTFGQNPEWFQSNDNNFGVLFTMSQVYSVGGGTDNCRIQLWQVTTPTSAADTAYSLPLNGFRVLQDCGSGLSASATLAQQAIAQIDFKANAGAAKLAAGPGDAREGANLNVPDGGGLYPTTIVIRGPLRFE